MPFLRSVVLIFVLIPVAVSPQSPSLNNVAFAAADKAYSSQNWTEAEIQYSALTKQSSANAHYWYRLSISARHRKDFDIALNAMQKAKTLGASNGLPAFIADYEIADTYAAMGDSDRALMSLKASADGGF